MEWIALIIVIIEHFCGHRRALTLANKERYEHRIEHDSNGHHSPHCSRANTMVSWWRQDADGVVWKVA